MPKVLNRKDSGIPEGAVYIGRGSVYGNPYRITPTVPREEAIRLYKALLERNPELVALVKEELRGKDLVCFCAPKACHGDILLEVANNDDLYLSR